MDIVFRNQIVQPDTGQLGNLTVSQRLCLGLSNRKTRISIIKGGVCSHLGNPDNMVKVRPFSSDRDTTTAGRT